eukprot:jgi/Chlat1/337/Chrsp1S03189
MAAGAAAAAAAASASLASPTTSSSSSAVCLYRGHDRSPNQRSRLQPGAGLGRHGGGGGGKRRLVCRALSADAATAYDGGKGGDEGGNGKGHGGSGRGGGGGGGAGDDARSARNRNSLLGLLSQGWEDRVRADPSFAFKVLVEQVIGVSACVIGDMSARPNFGLNELDFVFSTMVVGSILNFTLMYMLAPTGASSSLLPGIFAKCPPGHMFEPGAYTIGQRAGTCLYKGVQFALVGLVAGVAGTALSNALLDVRKKLNPNFKSNNENPPLLLNAYAWALHMGISSNLRYQGLNGFDLAMTRRLSPQMFRPIAIAIRTANNVLGGVSFSVLARWTGAQKSATE